MCPQSPVLARALPSLSQCPVQRGWHSSVCAVSLALLPRGSGGAAPQLGAPTPCHRAAAGPSRRCPLPGVTLGGCCGAPPCPPCRYQPPAGVDLVLAGQACRAGPGSICMCRHPAAVR